MRTFSRALLVLALSPACAIASGKLDPVFGGDGTVTLHASATAAGSERLNAGIVDRAGRYVGVGTGNGFNDETGTVLRLLRNGARDASFGDNGVVRLPEVPGYGSTEWHEVIELVDQRLLIAGRAQNGPGVNDPGRIVVCRLLESGALDPQYDGDGCLLPVLAPASQRDSLDGMALQPDGRLVIVGRTDVGNDGIPYEWTVARFEADGGNDPCFGDLLCLNGGVLIEPEPDSDITSFTPADVAIAPNGKVVIAGTATGLNGQDFAVVKLNANGTVDAAGFGNQGHRLVGFDQGGLDTDNGRAIAVRDDGAIFVAGRVGLAAGTLAGVAAMDQFGTPLPGFGVAGKTTFFFNDIAPDHIPNRIQLQADGKLVISGDTDDQADPDTLLGDCGVARLRTDGTLDPVFAFDGIVSYDADLGLTDPLTDRCGGLALSARRIALFGTHQVEEDGAFDALMIVLEQDELFRDGFEQ